APEGAGAAANARAEIGVEEALPSLDERRLQAEIGTRRHAIAQQAAPIATQLQALDHCGHDGMVDAGDGETVEGDVAKEGLELMVHVLDGLEVVEMLRV